MNKKFLTTTSQMNTMTPVSSSERYLYADILARYYGSLKYDSVYILPYHDTTAIKALNLSSKKLTENTDEKKSTSLQKLWPTLKKEDVYKRKTTVRYCSECKDVYNNQELLNQKTCPIHTSQPLAMHNS